MISCQTGLLGFPSFLSSSLAFVARWLPPYFLSFIVPVGLLVAISCHAGSLGFIYFFLFSLGFYDPFVFILLYFYFFFFIFLLAIGHCCCWTFFFPKMGINKRKSNGLRDYTKCTPTNQ